MGLTKCILGHYLELCSNKNTDLVYGIDDVRGVNNLKQLMTTKADLNGRDLSKFQIVNPGEFVFNHRTSRNGSKFSIAYNDGDKPIICTEDYVVFKIRDDCKKILNARWLYMFFNRPEFDRFVITNSWGSSTEFYNWEDIQAIGLELPPLLIQRKYANVYNAMLENQKSYESGLDDLKLVCDAYIEDLRRKLPCDIIGNYVHQYNEKNNNGEITLEQGININKRFINPQRTNDNFYGRKIVRTGQIAYCTQLNNENIAVALRTGPDCIVSNVYDVIEFNENSGLIPEYLMLWLVRAEFGRFVYWASQGTSYEFLAYDNLANYKIPVPDYEVQKSIVGIYNVYNERREINEKLKAQIKDICPILIKGSIEEARKAKEA
ncbi:restriction endonuclease subunit S [Blautia obeum]|uniref:Restriction endonuclease subunit S n=1 Tax=Blautia obeum TaxID=40520 RepID=A0A454HGX5_9FIRM|nr:restriction endonuclease subunit S [Blautia obeum]RGS16229.1 restriction endonuclease subunit S [Blautia obeum]RHC06326.1 restriction endonuclease subunit S [Blautia obeum]